MSFRPSRWIHRVSRTFQESTWSCPTRLGDFTLPFGAFFMAWRWGISPFRNPSALRSARLSAGILTTMASADSSRPLRREVSPSKVRSLSARAARFYLTCLSVTFGFRRHSEAYRPCPASLPVRVPAVVPLLPLPTAWPHGFTVRFATVTVTVSGHLLSDDKTAPMSGTRAPTSPSAFSPSLPAGTPAFPGALML